MKTHGGRNKIMEALMLVLLAQSNVFPQSDNDVAQLKQRQLELELELSRAQAIIQATIKIAVRLRYQAISIAMAKKSQAVYDKELAGLLALQTYRFEVDYGGYWYESSVFSGLTEALGRFGYQFKSTATFPETVNADSTLKFSVKSNPNGEILLVNNKTNAIRYRLAGHSAAVTKFSFSGSSKFLASSDTKGKILIWNLEDLSMTPRSIVFGMPIQSMDFSIDDSELRITVSRGTTIAWPLSHAKLAVELEKYLTRNLTQEEWEFYVAPDLPRERTVSKRPMD